MGLGTQRFLNVPALRGRVKEILNSRSDDEQLKPDGSDFKLIKSLLEFHPSGPEKSKGLVGIEVAKSIQGDSRCFFMIKEGGVIEDFSPKKAPRPRSQRQLASQRPCRPRSQHQQRIPSRVKSQFSPKPSKKPNNQSRPKRQSKSKRSRKPNNQNKPKNQSRPKQSRKLKTQNGPKS